MRYQWQCRHKQANGQSPQAKKPKRPGPKKVNLAPDVVEVLSGATITEILPDGDASQTSYLLRLPDGQLERQLYLRVNKVLAALGGKWQRQLKGHIFARQPDLATILAQNRLELPREGWFPTPAGVTGRMIELAQLEPTHRVLEPSAGEGAIADLVHQSSGVPTAQIVCVETNPERAKVLVGKGYPVHRLDFMSLTTRDLGRFDRVLMNPPFENLQEVHHLLHAYHHFLSPGGALVAVVSNAPFFRAEAIAVEFRKLLAELADHSQVIELPAGTFTIPTRLVVLRKPAGDAWDALLCPPGDYAEFGLALADIEAAVRRYLQEIWPNIEILTVEVYGSRTDGTSIWGADLDVRVVYGGGPPESELAGRLGEVGGLILPGAFGSLPVKLKVDIVVCREEASPPTTVKKKAATPHTDAEQYISNLAKSLAQHFAPGAIYDGREGALRLAREVGYGLASFPDEVIRAIEGSLYSRLLVRFLFGRPGGVPLNNKSWLTEMRRAINEVRSSKFRVQS